MKKSEKIGAWTAGIVGTGVLALLAANTYLPLLTLEPTPEPTSIVSVYDTNGFSEAPPKPTPTPEPVVEVAPVVEDGPEEPSGPTLCPDGWFASSVDENGNESGCSEGNEAGQPCVSYGENNECVAWYQP